MKTWVENGKKLIEKSIKPVATELNEIDWKYALSPNKDRLAEHISAMANLSGGGYFVFGVNDDGTTRSVESPEVKLIVEEFGNIARTSVTPEVIVQHEIVEYEGKNLLLICIQESLTKPVHLSSGDMSDSFIRSGAQTRKMTLQEISLAISHSTGLTFETKLATQDLTADEVLEKLDFVSYFDLNSKKLPSNSVAIVESLTHDDLVKKVDDRYRITNLGAILFAKDLHDFGDLERKAPRVVVYSGKDKINILKNLQGNKGYASGFVALIEYINNLLPSNEIINEALRTEVKQYPDRAIRELVANALIHQDFSAIGTGPIIEIFEDRLEITNPGKPLIELDRLLDLPPKSRNQKLASIMRRMKVCEELGSGIDRVAFECELHQLPAPSFFIKGDSFVATLYSPRSLTKMNKEDRIRACYFHACLMSIGGKTVTNQSVRKRFSISDESPASATKIINETLLKGYIKKKNPTSQSNRNVEYVPFWQE